MEKYGGVALSLEALESVRAQIASGQVPMVNNHSALQPLAANVTDARIEPTRDGEHALLIDFEMTPEEWAGVEAGWKAAGSSGGFSISAGELQVRLGEGTGAAISLAADAVAFTDEVRAEAGEALSAIGPVDVSRQYDFALGDAARILLEIPPEFWTAVASGVASNLIVGALSRLLRTRRSPSTIEIRVGPKARHITAVIRTADPKVVDAAIRSINHAVSSDAPLVEFDSETGLWLPREYGNSD